MNGDQSGTVELSGNGSACVKQRNCLAKAALHRYLHGEAKSVSSRYSASQNQP
jgi:hypothetical protein